MPFPQQEQAGNDCKCKGLISATTELQTHAKIGQHITKFGIMVKNNATTVE
jgi:hypothetical protein